MQRYEPLIITGSRMKEIMKEEKDMAETGAEKDIYADLKSASTAQLLEAVIGAFERGEVQGSPDFIAGLGFALKIAGPNGWEQIAPKWLRTMKEGYLFPSPVGNVKEV